ncbi:MAG: DUF1080 domain-containing protein [Verrucomicrobiota bacterium]|nr:DUF1080 domain-containing protein [Verrucomicrobiota bacterium]
MRSPMRALTYLSLVLVLISSRLFAATPEQGFTSLFDGESLKGWTLIGKNGQGYVIKDGVLICPKDGGGNLFTERQYTNFIFRFEFKLDDGSNNGLGIRAPLEGDAAYLGMEIQILDDTATKWGKLRDVQYHGGIYDVFPPKRGALKKIGEWNEEEVIADGRRIKVILNGQVIVDADINSVNDPVTIAKHPGLFRAAGHIGFLGHNEYVEFRNLRIKELPSETAENTPPQGFTALFNGKDLTGWKGLVADPLKRAKMSMEELAREQAKADERMRAHWKVENGTLVFDGKGDSLCSAKDFADFELLVDWKIKEKGDSGIYLRGSPQVQIWDRNDEKPNPKRLGSGGLYNNQKNPSGPLLNADNPIGEWNRFRIIMVGEKVHVFLNEQLVVNNTTLENYWDRNQPIFPFGQIELQNHGNTLWFKNIYIREIQPPAR